jgi:hypothetical protein
MGAPFPLPNFQAWIASDFARAFAVKTDGRKLATQMRQRKLQMIWQEVILEWICVDSLACDQSNFG